MSNLTREDLELIDALIAARLGQIRMPIGRDGVIVADTYDKETGTATVRYGDTATMFDDTSDTLADHREIPLTTSHYGSQYGPRGDEPVTIFNAQGGPLAVFHYEGGTAPGAPPGEYWIAHYNDAGAIDSFTKYTNDGPTSGDGLGGVQHNGGALNELTTTSGHSVRLDDTAKTLTVQSAGGTAKTIYDAGGNALSHIAPAIGIGDLALNMPAGKAAIVHDHLDQFEQDLHDKRFDDLSKMATAVSGALATASPPVTVSAATIVALIASLLHVPVPEGSRITKIATGTGWGTSRWGVDAWGQ